VLAFVRSPLEWQVSNFNQHFKRNSLINLSDEYLWSLLGYKSLNNVVNVLEELAICEDVSLRVIRYDPTGGKLLTMLSGLLGVDPQKFQLPAFPRANRSHSYSELYVLQQLRLSGVENTELTSLSLQWMSELPDLKVEPFYPSLAFQQAYWSYNETVLDRLNGFLPDDEQFSPQFYTPFEPPEQLEFAPVQLDVLLRFLSERSLKLEI
jgi:hypothetical protein